MYLKPEREFLQGDFRTAPKSIFTLSIVSVDLGVICLKTRALGMVNWKPVPTGTVHQHHLVFSLLDSLILFFSVPCKNTDVLLF